MRTVVMGLALSAATLTAVPVVNAETVVRVRAGAANTDYEVEFDGGPYAGRTAKSDFTATALGLTLVSDSGFYFDIVTQSSGDATHDLWRPSPDQNFSRDDFTLTLGATLPSDSGAFSAFAGYKSGESELRSPTGLNAWTRDTFETDGFFFGLGYGFPAAGGQFGLNGALAFMSGTWTDDNGFNNEADYTFGYSFGVSYTYLFGKSFGINADFKTQLYSYDFNVYSGGSMYTVDESINSLGLNVFAQF